MLSGGQARQRCFLADARSKLKAHWAQTQRVHRVQPIADIGVNEMNQLSASPSLSHRARPHSRSIGRAIRKSYVPYLLVAPMAIAVQTHIAGDPVYLSISGKKSPKLLFHFGLRPFRMVCCSVSPHEVLPFLAASAAFCRLAIGNSQKASPFCARLTRTTINQRWRNC